MIKKSLILLVFGVLFFSSNIVILLSAKKSSHPENKMREDCKGQSIIFSHHIGTACMKLQNSDIF